VTGRRVRVGVIGTGFGAAVQIPAFQANPRFEVVAVASGQPRNAHRVASEFEIAHAFARWEDLISADLDLVSVTAPPHLHHAMTVAAIGAGRHVLCEKPMALAVSEAEDMVRRAEAAGIVAVIDHELRFNLNRRKVKRLIADGYIGEPRHVLITYIGAHRADPDQPWTWWNDASRGGGVLGAVGSHQIDLLRYWLGEIEAVSGALATYVKQRPADDGAARRVTADDLATFWLRFASGAVASVFLSLVAAHSCGPRVEVWGAEGSLVIDADERLWGARRGRDFEELTEPDALSPPPRTTYWPLWSLGFVRLADHLAAAILDGGALAPAATFRDGLAVQRVIAALMEKPKTN